MLIEPWWAFPDVGKGVQLVDRPDEDLVRAAACGDVDGFMELCRRYYPTMVAIARGILGDHHFAEDAAQEALARACRRLPSLNEPRRFGAWLATICRNQATDMVRRTPKMESLGARDVPADVPQQSADLEAVRRAVESLPPESREVLYLKYRGDLSHQQMSDLLGISLQAVHGRLKRAKQAVREYLERQQNRRRS
jgi:RNA polymerase sigma-70 factor (ECF subfamily)